MFSVPGGPGRTGRGTRFQAFFQLAFLHQFLLVGNPQHDVAYFGMHLVGQNQIRKTEFGLYLFCGKLGRIRGRVRFARGKIRQVFFGQQDGRN